MTRHIESQMYSPIRSSIMGDGLNFDAVYKKIVLSRNWVDRLRSGGTRLAYEHSR